jgi:hypothetical protein
MKRLLRALAMASVGPVVVLAATSAFGISDKQTLHLGRNVAGIAVLDQNAFLEEEKAVPLPN